MEPGANSSYIQIFPKKDKNQVHHLGLLAIELPAYTNSCEIYLRPDVKEACLIELIEQVFLSLGGGLMNSSVNPTSPSIPATPTIRMKQSNESCTYKEIHAYIASNVNFQKIIYLVVISNHDVNQASFVQTLNQYISTQQQEYDQQCHAIFQQVLQAYQSESFCMEAFPYLEYMEEDKANEVLQCKPSNWKVLEMQQSTESLIDLGYIRDLQSAAAHLMNSKILQEVELVDKMMKSFELKCAKLMTLLKTSYQRASLSLPSPPEVKSLTTYPLQLKRESIRDLQPETWKIMLLRSRKNIRDQKYSESSFSSFHQTQLVIIDIIRQFQQWAEEEYQIRIGRKIQSVKDRFESLQRFKLQLILTLHDRFNLQKANNQSDNGGFGGIISGISGLGNNGIWSFAAFNTDRKFQMALQEKFPFLDFYEPCVYDCTAVIEQKTGLMYITAGHVLFHSTNHLLVSNMLITVIPLKTIQRIDMLRSDMQVVTSITYQSETDTSDIPNDAKVSEEISGNESLMEPNAGGMQRIIGNSLRIIDQSKKETIIRFTETTPEFAARIFDLLDLLLKEKLFSLCEYRSDSRQNLISLETQRALEGIMNIEDVLEVITFSTGEMSFEEPRTSGASVNGESPLSNKTFSNNNNNNSSSSRVTNADITADSFSSSTLKVKENDNIKEDLATQETPKVPQKKNLANNIQKFLQKSQATSTKLPPQTTNP